MDDRQKAFHEGGHAVSALISELPIEYVTIDRHNIDGLEVYGLCKWNVQELQSHFGGDPDWMRKKAAFYFAGLTAERQYLEKFGGQEDLDAWSRDVELFRACVRVRKDALGLTFSQVADEIESYVQSLFRQPSVWEGLNRIVDELCTARWITGDQTKRLFESIA